METDGGQRTFTRTSHDGGRRDTTRRNRRERAKAALGVSLLVLAAHALVVLYMQCLK